MHVHIDVLYYTSMYIIVRYGIDMYSKLYKEPCVLGYWYYENPRINPERGGLLRLSLLWGIEFNRIKSRGKYRR